MIIARSPNRITLGGGGTDAPDYVAEHGGFAITAAITKHVCVGVNEMFRSGYLLRYSEMEYVQDIRDIRHPIIREALRFYNVPSGIELWSMADLPSGAGLGSSAVFTVALCTALSAYIGLSLTRDEIAKHAVHIELGMLGRPGGQQDHWASALGGVQALKFLQGGTVTHHLVADNRDTYKKLEASLRLFFTWYSRDAGDILAMQTHDGLDEIKRNGYKAHFLLAQGAITDLGELMNYHWQLKRQRHPQMSNVVIDHYYDVAIANGAIGGKLVGAGGGGFLLFVTDDHDKLTHAMSDLGLRETKFNFDHEGCSIIATD